MCWKNQIHVPLLYHHRLIPLQNPLIQTLESYLKYTLNGHGFSGTWPHTLKADSGGIKDLWPRATRESEDFRSNKIGFSKESVDEKGLPDPPK